MTCHPDLRVDEAALEEHGYVLLPGLASADDIAEFERVIGDLCRAQIKSRGLAPRHPDPFTDVMLADEKYRRYLFPLVKQLHIVQRISADVGRWLASSGFLGRHQVRAPLVWPYFRADLPEETVYQLPFHQDVVSTLSEKSWRIWLPLRPVDRQHGTMEILPGTHKAGLVPHKTGQRVEAEIDDEFLAGRRHECIEAPGGCGVLFHPHLIHRSVINRSDRVRFTILIQVQDAAGLFGPDGQSSPAAQPNERERAH